MSIESAADILADLGNGAPQEAPSGLETTQTILASMEEEQAPEPPPEASESITPASVRDIAVQEMTAERERLRQSEERRRTDERMRELEGLEEALSKPDVLKEIARRRGVSELDILTELNQSVIQGRLKPTTPQDKQQAEIQELRDRLKAIDDEKNQAKAQLEFSAAVQKISESITHESYPLIHAHGGKQYAELAERLAREQSAKTGEPIDVQATLKGFENELLQDVQKLIQDPHVRARLGLSPSKQTSREDRAADESVTLTGSDASIRARPPTDPDDEEYSNDAELRAILEREFSI